MKKRKKYCCEKTGPNGEKCTYETNSYFLTFRRV